MEQNTKQKSQGFISLIPLIAFFAIYLCSGFICTSKGMEKAFSQLPTSVAAFCGLFLALFIVKGSMQDKFQWIIKGVAKPGVQVVVIICILLGGFSTITKICGGVDSIVGICMNYIPKSIITAAFFVTASIISFASSSSMLSIVAVAPVALAVAEEAGISIPITVAAIMGAAAFGNTLSPISDITTVSNSVVGIMGKASKDKLNAQAKLYVLPYIATVVLLLIFGRPIGAVQSSAEYTINLWSLIPYVVTLALALIGFNFVVSLSSGIFSGLIVGLALGKFQLLEGLRTLGSGFSENANMTWMFIFVSAIIGIASETGGIDWIVEKLSKLIRGAKSAQLVLLALGMIVTLCIGNNSIPILAVGDITVSISKKYKIDPRRLATLLVVSSGFVVPIIPHSGIGLCMSGLMEGAGVSVSFLQCVPYNWFVWLVFAMVILTTFLPFNERHYAKDPWDFEQGCLESGKQETGTK